MFIKARFQLLTVSGLLFFCLLHSSAQAAAWLLPQGHVEWHQTQRWYDSDRFYTTDGKRVTQPRYTKMETETYAEYGLSDDFTIGTQFAVYRATNETVAQYNHGLADPTFFIRKELWKDDSSVFSVQPLIKLPSVSRNEFLPRSGTEATDLELRLLGGHSFEWLERDHFANAELAYRKRLKDFGDQIRLDLTLGSEVFDNWVIMPQIFSIFRTGGTGRNSRIQFFENDFSLIKGSLAAIFRWNDSKSIQFTAFHDVWGENTGQGRGVSLTFTYRAW